MVHKLWSRWVPKPWSNLYCGEWRQSKGQVRRAARLIRAAVSRVHARAHLNEAIPVWGCLVIRLELWSNKHVLLPPGQLARYPRTTFVVLCVRAIRCRVYT
jgi:hypothetical protein